MVDDNAAPAVLAAAGWLASRFTDIVAVRSVVLHGSLSAGGFRERRHS